MRIRQIFIATLAGAVLALSGMAQAPQTAPPDQKKTVQSKSTQATAAPTDAEIADAKSKGLVWANTSSKIYHKSGSSDYGKTKRGKFMTEDDAVKGGYRAAKEPGGSKGTQATTKKQ